MQGNERECQGMSGKRGAHLARRVVGEEHEAGVAVGLQKDDLSRVMNINHV